MNLKGWRNRRSSLERESRGMIQKSKYKYHSTFKIKVGSPNKSGNILEKEATFGHIQMIFKGSGRRNKNVKKNFDSLSRCSLYQNIHYPALVLSTQNHLLIVKGRNCSKFLYFKSQSHFLNCSISDTQSACYQLRFGQTVLIALSHISEFLNNILQFPRCGC